jgi:eukaryotic-like serine/threonine-protein kinase
MKFTYASGQKPLDGYTIKRGIGRGGFGEVYFGVSERGKEVAMKLIQANLDIELRGIGQCLNLKHPNLVHLYDLRSDAHDDHWLIMEYLAGDSLNAILARNPHGVAPELAGQWFQGLAGAVHHLHDHGIVHRDLKPGNIFLENGLIKVGDYGLCKTIGNSRNLKQTQSVGTVHYMAPEISTGNYNQQVDIYAAGIILYEMLTGQVPFDGESALEILFKHQTEKPDLTRVPEAFAPILERALRKSPARRYPSIHEMAKDVEALVTPKNGSATQPRLELSAGAVARHEAPTQVMNQQWQRLASASGPLLAATGLAAVSAFVLGVLLNSGGWNELAPVLFFLTTLSCAAVLLPAQIWSKPAEESWERRLIFMGLGLAIGLAGLWFDAFQLPWPGLGDVDSLKPYAGSEARHPFFGKIYPNNESLPVLACYLSYFGLMFLALRWWKIAEENRLRRVNAGAIWATAFWAYLLLFLLPATHQRQEGFLSLVLTSVIVQLVSPWEPRNQERSKKLRLRNA